MKKLAFFAAVVTIAAFSCWATEGYDDLVKLVKSGVGEEVVLAFINSSATGFALTPDEILHLKDMAAGPDKKFAPVGTGILDFKAILATADKYAVKFGAVEQDNCYETPPLDAIRTSYENLRKLGAK